MTPMNGKNSPEEQNDLFKVEMNKETGRKELIYLYCVTNKKPELKKVKNLADELYFINEEELYAIVSKVSDDEFSEENLKKNLADLEWVKRKASIHEKIIEEVMKRTCVVPFKFATLFKTEFNLKAMLSEQSEVIRENLKSLKDKEEWGVKIYCDREKLKESLFQENEKISKIAKEIKAASPGKAFLLKKKKEELLNTEINLKINEYGKESFDSLREQSLQSRINKLLPKEVTERKEDMILNSVFLIGKRKVADFLNVAENLRTRYGDKGLIFDCTGPWPPYNFCLSSSETSHFPKQRS